MMHLRPYQSEAIEAVKADWANGIRETLLVAATGAGKTIMLLRLAMDALDADPQARCLLMAHRRELIEQPIERLRAFDPDWLGRGALDKPRVGIIQAGRRDLDRQLTIATVQSLRPSRVADLLRYGKITHLVVDECFPAGTQVDGRPIETLRPGDLVRSYNHATEQVEMRPIVRLFRNPVRSLVRVTFNNGKSIVCTPGHPFYAVSIFESGYVAAVDLLPDCMVKCIMPKQESIGGAHGDQAERMRSVRHDVSASQLEPAYDPDLLGGVQDCATGRTNEDCHTALCGVRHAGRVQGAFWPRNGTQGPRILLRGLQDRLSAEIKRREYGRNQSKVCIGANESKQSDASLRYTREDERNAAGDRAQAKSARRQWAPPARAAAVVIRSAAMADRGYCANEDAATQRTATANALQVGYCEPGIDDRNRSGRLFPCCDRASSARCEEAELVDFARVASVEVLEPGSDGRFGGLCPDSHVYNIEVEGNHNYFADGVLVHNCHHATADTYLRVREMLLEANPDLCHLGVTATPIRADGDGLAKVYQKDSARVTIADLVKQHYLVQPRWLAISTGISIDGVHTRGGDYVASELANRFDTPYGRQIVIQAYQKYAAGRHAVAFTASVEGAHALAAAFRDAGVSAASVSGETPAEERSRILSDFKAGRTQVIANCQILTEGWDAPIVGCVLMCRPTKSDSLYLQCIGRGLRPSEKPEQTGESRFMAVPGEDCLILDFVPEGSRNIVMAGDVLGIPKEQAKAARELLQEEAEPGEVQLGFTFDGHNFDTSGTPLEIIARQLDYLNASRWQWGRRDGWLTLGLGPGADGVDRTLAIAPTDEGHTLYGLRREPLSGPESGDRRYGRWQIAFTRSGPLEALCELAERQADRYAVAVLAQKNRTWHKRPATEGQLKYLRRLAPKGERLPGFITSGEAGALITFYQVRQTIDRLCDVSH